MKNFGVLWVFLVLLFFPSVIQASCYDSPWSAGMSTKPSYLVNPPAGLPDFIVIKIWLEDENGKEKNIFRPGEKIKMKTQVKNVGADSPHDIEVRFYLSNGENVDSNKQHVGTENISDYNMEGGETRTETEEISAPATSKTYNITACVDTQHSVVEEHESNNCSDEAIFSVQDLSWFPAVISIITD